MSATLITGAARRLGRSIALELARAGHDLALHWRGSRQEVEETAVLCRAHGVRAEPLQADLDQEEPTRALVGRAVAALGRLDHLVNNASRFEQDRPEDLDYALFDAHMRANLAAPLLLARCLHAHLVERDGRGAVVNLLDQKLWNMNPDFFSYTLSKAALHAAGPAMALAFAPRLRVVGVAPGLTLTSHLLDEERFAALHRLSPTGRSSTPEDVAASVRFALENGSLNGSVILVDGGQHLLRFERDFSLMGAPEDR